MPNLSDHTIGEGMLYAKTAEWYDYHGYRYPYLWSFITTSAYQFMNETIENGAYKGTSVDCISDMLIYNTSGFILFSINPVKEFFSSTLPLYDWSLQPILDATSGYLFNAGEQFVIKRELPFGPRYSGSSIGVFMPSRGSAMLMMNRTIFPSAPAKWQIE